MLLLKKKNYSGDKASRPLGLVLNTAYHCFSFSNFRVKLSGYKLINTNINKVVMLLYQVTVLILSEVNLIVAEDPQKPEEYNLYIVLYKL